MLNPLKKLKSKKQHSGVGSSRYYRGRATQTSSQSGALKKQKEYRRKKLSAQRRAEVMKRVRGYAWIAIGLAALLFLFNLSQIRSHEFVGLTGLKESDKQVVTALTNDYVSGLQRFKLFFDAEAYTEYVRDNASFIGGMQASTSLFSTQLNVRITPKSPLYPYRGAVSNSAQWIASDGSLISLTDQQQADITLEEQIVVRDSSGIDYEEGQSILSRSQLDFLVQLRIELGSAGEEITDYELLAQARDIRVGLGGKKYDLLVSTDRPVESIAADYTLLKEESAQLAQAGDYVDLRIVDKVFVR